MTLKYKGGGFLRGVPARDLTDEEAKTYGEGFLIGTGLYESLVRTSGEQFVEGIIAGLEESKREQQAPAAPEKSKRKTKRDNWKQLLKDG